MLNAFAATLYCVCRSVGCQVNIEHSICMHSYPMWEISSEESCLSHGCAYINGECMYHYNVMRYKMMQYNVM